jgi:predicted fused transcriptional regulator/phosphomethylpyrimidine kinase
MVEEGIFIKSEDAIELKKAIAQLLYQDNMDQLAIAQFLDLSQAMVSIYCKNPISTSNDILNQAKQIVHHIEKGNSIHFQTCILFSKKQINGHLFIGDKNEFITNENNSIVNNLTQSFQNLTNINLHGFVPEIKINIAMAKENATNSDDIAAFVNGLIIVDEKIVGYNGVRFGCSKHLSSLLLKLCDGSNIRATMNIAYFSNLKNSSFSTSYLGNNFELLKYDSSVDILLHDGDFGIEPCAYILGKDAIDVSEKLKKIIDEVRHEK